MNFVFRRFIRLIAALLLLGIAQAQIRVLLIEGASNHGWENRIGILESILSKAGGFELTVELAPANASEPAWSTWSPDFASHDVVISGYRGGVDGVPEWPSTAKQSFESFVSAGGGFVAFHEATQAFPAWPEYQSIIALGWRTASVADTGVGIQEPAVGEGDPSLIFYESGVGSITGHGDRADSLVTKFGNHPIHAGLPAAWMAADLEVVRYPRGPAANLTVLSFAIDPDPGEGNEALQWPVEWVVNYGLGRVYASTYGHLDDFQAEPEGMRCAAFQENLIRALRWCAGENPPAQVPPDFPGLTEIVLRPHTVGLAGFGGAVAIEPYANGILPDSSIVPTGVEIVPAFPNLSWDSPIDARPWPGSPGKLLIAEMDGRVFRVDDDDDATTRELVLDIQNRAWYMNWSTGSPNTKHGGIMSCAFHPQFGTGVGKDELFIYYLHHPTDDPDGTSQYYQRVERFLWNPTAEVFDVAPNDGGILIQQYDTVKGHDGGSLVFGPDGFLYIPFGDEGTAGDDADSDTQKIDDRPRSGVWRIDVDQIGGLVSHPIRRQPFKAQPYHDSYTQGYYIPSDNPWVNPDGSVLEEFYAIGLREPHRMSCDPVTGKFWIGDVGANVEEEIDVMDAPGLNFQWNYKEGLGEGFRDAPVPLIGEEREPVYAYDHSLGTCIIGGFVYRGSAIPDLQGKYLFGDNGNQLVRALEVDPVTGEFVAVEELGSARPGNIWVGLSSFGLDTQGEPFVLQMGGGVPGGGLISRIKPAGATSTLQWEYPALLSATGLFTDLTTLTPAPAMIPYEVNTPLWSAGLAKRRWLMIPSDGIPDGPDETIGYSENQSWTFPLGTVFVKHFEQPDDGTPIETRIMVHGVDGWGGVTYKWRTDGSEADLLEEGLEESLSVEGETFDYQYPSRAQCNLCHTPAAGFVLGYRTRQLNRYITYPSGVVGHQIESLSSAGFITQEISAEDLVSTITSVAIDDPVAPVQDRVRSYLDSNCAHCHQPGGSSRAFFDTRLTTPLTNQGLICGPLIETLGLPAPAVIKPGSVENSVLFHRMNTTDDCCAMPPLAKGRIDQEAIVELAEWILGMTPDSCTSAQSFFAGGEFGTFEDSIQEATEVDVWSSNILIRKDAGYTHAGLDTLEVQVNGFSYQSASETGALTPFLVRVDAVGEWTVVAIGETRSTHEIGWNLVAFDDVNPPVILAPGESLLPGCIDAEADGSGGDVGGIVVWQDGGELTWHGGGASVGDSGSVVIGSPPDSGSLLVPDENRSYHFDVDLSLAPQGMGNDPSLANGLEAPDGASSNFVVDLSNTFTNSSSESVTLNAERFRFHASRVTDPITPFVMRVGPEDALTVLAIGDTLTTYQVGVNDVPFSSSGVFQVGAGETIAVGFMDSAPDGSGGDGPGMISYLSGGGDLLYYLSLDEQGSSIAVGEAPILRRFKTSVSRRYLFSIGFSPIEGLGGADSWDSNIVIQTDQIYTNATPYPVRLGLDRFRYQSEVSEGALTPFLVKSGGAANLSVLAVGDTVTNHSIGWNDVSFGLGSPSVVLLPGESVAPGFIDAFPDGTGGAVGGIIRKNPGRGMIWHGGGPTLSDAGSVVTGALPDAGAALNPTESGSYQFGLSYIVTALRLGNELDLEGFVQVDGANSNFMVNLSDTFTNTTGETLTISVDRFRFHASRVTDPLTPFVVRLDGEGDMTVIAIGSSRSVYQVGENDVPFGSGVSLIQVADGETIAVGFMDSLPDGTGGTQNGAVSFIDGGDEIFGYYHIIDEGSRIEIGQTPVVQFYTVKDPRSYLFSIDFGFGGPSDQDGDGLPDAWELVYAPGLGQFSATADFDNDGISDGDEREAATDPTDPNSRFELLDVRPDGMGGVMAEFSSIPGREYEIEWSDDFVTWTLAGTITASDWPMETTNALLPGTTFGGHVPRRLFVRVINR